MNANRAAAFVFILLGLILAVQLSRFAGPAPKPDTAPETEFSALRAVAALREIVGGDVPHPVGSEAHDGVRERLVLHLAGIGYHPTVQRTFACDSDAACAAVSNVIAELPGDARAEVLLVTAHYDSVLAGPGASDDGVGVAAIVEVARAIRNERFRNTVRFLLTDGEEAGLLGAEGYVADTNAMRRVAAAINVEDRGTSGPSFMFETSHHNRWLIRMVAHALPRPATSSLFYEIYEMLPNDTDLTVFKRAGLAGVNFAAIGHVAHYHTPLDNLAHVRPSLVQDHGDHLLAMTRALANADLRQSTDDNAVYFDVLSLITIWWPQGWTVFIAAGTLILLLIAATIRVRSGETTSGAVAIGIVSFFLSIAAAIVLSLLTSWIISLRAPAANWLAQPGPSMAAAWLIGIAASIAVAGVMHARAGFEGLFIGHGICWAALGIALTRSVTGASYMAVVPALAIAICVTLTAIAAADVRIGAVLCACVAGVLYFPLALVLYDALGRSALVMIATILALASTTFAPIVAAASSMRRAVLAAFAVTAAACIVMQLLIPPYTPDSPRRLNIRYVDDGRAVEWEADALTLPLRSAAPLRLTTLNTPWLPRAPRIFTAAAPLLAYAPPEARVISDSRDRSRRMVVQIRSFRGAQRMSLTFRSSGLDEVRINGVVPPRASLRHVHLLANGWHRLTVRGAQEATIEIRLPRNEEVEAFIADYTSGLPPEGLPLLRARDASLAVPSDDGDGVLVMRKVSL